MMYAYGQKITFEHDVDYLHIWIEFKAPMNQLKLPDEDKFTVKINAVDYVPTVLSWRDAFSLMLTISEIVIPPAQVYVKYDEPSDGLETSWRKNWEPFGWTYAKNLAV